MTAPASTMHYEVLKTLGDCYAAQDRFDRARECYGQAAELEPALPGHQVGLGAVLLLEDKPLEAKAAFEAVLRADPDCPDALWGLALAHWQSADYAEAARLLARCVALLPDHGPAVLGLFHACRKLGDFAPVGKFLEQRLQKHPGDTQALLCQAEVQLAAGQRDAARQTLLTVQALDPANAKAGRMLAGLSAEA